MNIVCRVRTAHREMLSRVRGAHPSVPGMGIVLVI